MAESSRALACLALLCIDERFFGMSHSFQYIIVGAISKSGVSLACTRSNISEIVFQSLAQFCIKKFFQVINFSVKFIDFVCLCSLFCFSLPGKNI